MGVSTANNTDNGVPKAGMSLQFPGVALVTGAGGTGIGAEVAKGFARAGCRKIAITDISQDALVKCRNAVKETAGYDERQVKVIMFRGDISDDNFVTKLVKEVVDEFGRIDYAVNCAGILGPALKSHETSVSLFDQINNVNYKGTWLVNRALFPRMKKQKALDEHPQQKGSIVNIASQLGIVGRPEAAPYCASKGAIIQMTKCDAIDYSQDNIRVNCVCPGVIATPMTTSSEDVKKRFQPAVDIAPMKRMGTPEEVANAVLFLCSSQASFIQGHALVVDGGYTIN